MSEIKVGSIVKSIVKNSGYGNIPIDTVLRVNSVTGKECLICSIVGYEPEDSYVMLRSEVELVEDYSYSLEEDDYDLTTDPYAIQKQFWEDCGVPKSRIEEAEEVAVDMVNHPEHYTTGGIETIDFILAKTYPINGDEGYLVGNIIKYLTRYPHKGNPRQDLEKARFYLNKLLEIVGDRYE